MSTHERGWTATLIGDLVESRQALDREGLQGDLEGALTAINALFEPPHPLRPTVGDEFQGGFSTVSDAVRASLLLRLELFERGDVDSRYGLGSGAIWSLERDSPGIEDGPGWWSARAAIDIAKQRASVPRTGFVRTSLGGWTSGPKGTALTPEAAAVNSFLLCRDAIVSQMSPRSRRNLHGLLRGRSQAELAKREKVTQSAISQDLSRSGAFAVEAAQRCLEERVS